MIVMDERVLITTYYYYVCVLEVVVLLYTCVGTDVMFIVNCVDFSFWLITQLLCTNTDSLERSKPNICCIYLTFVL